MSKIEDAMKRQEAKMTLSIEKVSGREWLTRLRDRVHQGDLDSYVDAIWEKRHIEQKRRNFANHHEAMMQKVRGS